MGWLPLLAEAQLAHQVLAQLEEHRSMILVLAQGLGQELGLVPEQAQEQDPHLG